jgi:hypothetical protein
MLHCIVLVPVCCVGHIRLLLNTVPVKLQVPKHGDELYANFRAPLHTWVLFNAESCCSPLLRALGEVSRTHLGASKAGSWLHLSCASTMDPPCTGNVEDPAHRVSELLVSGTLKALQRSSAKGGPDIRLGCVELPPDVTVVFQA